MLKTGLAFAGLVAFCFGCPLQARDLPEPRPEQANADVSIPASFVGIHSSPGISQATALSPGQWWQVFGDSALDALIMRMHAGNTQLQQATARLAAATAHAHSGAASQAPFVGATATASHEGGPLINKAGASGNLFTAGLAISWEADLLDRMSSARAAERLDAKAAAAALADTRLLMEAETVRTYFQAIYLQQVAAIAKGEGALWEERENIAVERMQHGLSQPLDLAALRQRANASAAAAAELARSRAETLDRLAFLIGDSTPPALFAHALPSAPEIPAGLPSDVLARRPDIAASLAHLQAADHRLDAARRSWLPTFGLTAAGGVASPTVGSILASSARSFGLDLLLALPLFDGGRRKARIAGNKAEVQIASGHFRETLLTALREVNDALAAIQASKVDAHVASSNLIIGDANVAIVSQRARHGTASQAQLIEARLDQSEDDIHALHAKFLQIAASVDLVKAIGGGWATR